MWNFQFGQSNRKRGLANGVMPEAILGVGGGFWLSLLLR